MAARQVADYLENGNITNSVNIPAAVLPRSGGKRVCIIHRNVPDMIAKITSALSAAGANIENMLNAGRKGNPYAYTIIDVDDVPDDVGCVLNQIEGIVRTRIL